MTSLVPGVAIKVVTYILGRAGHILTKSHHIMYTSSRTSEERQASRSCAPDSAWG